MNNDVLVCCTEEQYTKVRSFLECDDKVKYFEPMWFNILVLESDRAENNIKVTFATVLERMQQLRQVIFTDINDELDQHDIDLIVDFAFRTCADYLSTTDWGCFLLANCKLTKIDLENFVQAVFDADLLM